MVHIFIINQYAGNQHFEDELLKKIQKIENLEYYIFNTRCARDETAVVKQALKIFEGEKLRFYCCGGSGTMCNMLNGFDSLEEVELSFIPCGLTNDFLKVFGDDEELFSDPINLVHGKVINIDYLKTNRGIALNTVSWGWDSAYIKGIEQNRIFHVFGSKVPNILAFLFAGTHAKSRHLEITLDGKLYRKKYEELILGNGTIIGGIINFAENNNIMDGKASYCAITQLRGLSKLFMLKKLVNNKVNEIGEKCRFGTCTDIHIQSVDGKPISLNFDGELQEECAQWDIHVVKKGLKFVVPKGVQIIE